MGLAFRFRFWAQVQCFRPCDRDQHALTHVHHPCHLTNSTNWVHLMANNSSSAFASDGKIKTAFLNFGNGKGCVYFASWGCVYFASRGCFVSWGKIKYVVLYGWIGPMIFKNFADQDWIGFNFCGSGLDSDWKFSQSAHLWHTDYIFEFSAVSVFQNFGEVKLLLLAFLTTYFAEQGFCQVLHMRKEYRDRLDMNKTGGKAIRLKLTNFQTALKTLADKHHCKVRISWNQLAFGNE